MVKNQLTLTLPVRYDDLSSDMRASTAAMMRYMQHTAIMQADGIGQSLQNLLAMERCWVMLTWDYEEFHRPKVGEMIRVYTEAEGFGSCFGYRRFELFGENGDLYAKAYTIWAFYDIVNMRPARITPEVAAAYGLEDKEPLRIRPEKIALPEDAVEAERFTVRSRDTDTNHHVNNVRYIEMAQDALPSGFAFSKVKVYYEHAAVAGDEAVTFCAKAGDGYTVAVKAADGRTFATVVFA